MCTMDPLACINGGEFLQKCKALRTRRKALHTSPHCLFNMMGKSPSRSKGTYTLDLRPWGSSLGPRCKTPSSKGLLPYTNIRDINLCSLCGLGQHASSTRSVLGFVALPFYIKKKYLIKAKEELRKLKYFTMQKI